MMETKQRQKNTQKMNSMIDDKNRNKERLSNISVDNPTDSPVSILTTGILTSIILTTTVLLIIPIYWYDNYTVLR